MWAPPGGRAASTRTAATPVPSTTAGSAPTPRRLVGLSVLGLAVTAVLVTASIFGVGVRGSATAAVFPLPPPIGSCVLISDDDTATVVDCSTPHSGELAMTWRPGVNPVGAGSFGRDPHFSVAPSITNPRTDSRCTEWAERYVGWDRYLARHQDDLWLAPQPLTTGRLVRAPVDASVSGLAWTGCAALTADPSYLGSVRDVAFVPRLASGPRPAAVSVCLTSTHSSLSFGACAEPHNTELIGSISLTQQMMFDRSVTVGRTEGDVTRGCVELAAERLGRADPTFGGRLEVVAESVYQRSLRDEKPSPSAWLIPDCLVRVVGTGSITGSLVEWGDRPLTLAP